MYHTHTHTYAVQVTAHTVLWLVLTTSRQNNHIFTLDKGQRLRPTHIKEANDY